MIRFVVIALMCMGSVYYIDKAGSHATPLFKFKDHLNFLPQVLGNTTFIFMYHHAIPGIVYPIRPQQGVNRIFLYSNCIGAFFLSMEAILAYFAFASLENFCVEPDSWSEERDGAFIPQYPCKVSGLYNENFLNLPGIGQICNFYPLFNITVVPVLLITLRNNVLEVLPIKQFLRDRQIFLFLLDDHKRSIKGLWSIILSIPVIFIVLFYRNV